MERAWAEAQTVKDREMLWKGKYQAHSPRQNRSGLLRRTSDTGERNRLKPRREFQYYSGEEDSGEREEQYPLIELPNPQAGVGDNEPTVRVYRPWTQRDIEKAVEGIPHPKTGMAGFERDLNGLASSYRLNTGEIERAVRTIVGKDWFAVRGAWVPTGQDGNVIQWTEGPGDPFRAKITELCANLTVHYHRHADFSKITECRQGDSETVSQYLERLKDVFNANSGTPEPPHGGDQNTPYHQQLKIAFLTGMHPEVSKEVRKNLVGWGLATLAEVKRYAVHHEQHAQTERRKKENRKDAFPMSVLEDKVMGGREREDRTRPDGKGTSKGGTRKCYNCQKDGHFARECKAPCEHCGRTGHNHHDCKQKPKGKVI